MLCCARKGRGLAIFEKTHTQLRWGRQGCVAPKTESSFFGATFGRCLKYNTRRRELVITECCPAYRIIAPVCVFGGAPSARSILRQYFAIHGIRSSCDVAAAVRYANRCTISPRVPRGGGAFLCEFFRAAQTNGPDSRAAQRANPRFSESELHLPGAKLRKICGKLRGAQSRFWRVVYLHPGLKGKTGNLCETTARAQTYTAVRNHPCWRPVPDSYAQLHNPWRDLKLSRFRLSRAARANANGTSFLRFLGRKTHRRLCLLLVGRLYRAQARPAGEPKGLGANFNPRDGIYLGRAVSRRCRKTAPEGTKNNCSLWGKNRKYHTNTCGQYFHLRSLVGRPTVGMIVQFTRAASARIRFT